MTGIRTTAGEAVLFLLLGTPPHEPAGPGTGWLLLLVKDLVNSNVKSHPMGVIMGRKGRQRGGE